jgi:hypothetical protein
MKIRFSIVMGGQESFQQKFESTLKENPNLHMDLIKSFGQAVMMACRLNETDHISIESFIAEKAIENQEGNANVEQTEFKKVES